MLIYSNSQPTPSLQVKRLLMKSQLALSDSRGEESRAAQSVEVS